MGDKRLLREEANCTAGGLPPKSGAAGAVADYSESDSIQSVECAEAMQASPGVLENAATCFRSCVTKEVSMVESAQKADELVTNIKPANAEFMASVVKRFSGEILQLAGAAANASNKSHIDQNDVTMAIQKITKDINKKSN